MKSLRTLSSTITIIIMLLVIFVLSTIYVTLNINPVIGGVLALVTGLLIMDLKWYIKYHSAVKQFNYLSMLFEHDIVTSKHYDKLKILWKATNNDVIGYFNIEPDSKITEHDIKRAVISQSRADLKRTMKQWDKEII